MPYTLIQAFQNGKEPLAFSGASDSTRNKFAEELRTRVEKPYVINQMDAPLCGPAAFMFCLASAHPWHYVRYVIDLATHGEAILGNLHVKPSKNCLQANLRGAAISLVDWIALASLRDASNYLFSMRGAGSSVAGITGADTMASWFEKSGLFAQVNNQALYRPASLERLLSADLQGNLGSFVCLLVRAAITGKVAGEVPISKRSGMPKTLLGTPDHWIVLRGGMGLGPSCYNPNNPAAVESLLKKRLEFSVYSWGGIQKINDRFSSLSVKEFLPYFYGCVSAVPA